MSFRQLSAAIKSRDGKEPTVCMALDMTEALFADVDPYSVPLGDDNPALKLRRLCRVIQDIYSDNAGELGGNARLTAAMASLDKLTKQLDEIAVTEEQTARARQRAEELQSEIAVAAQRKAEFDRLTGEIGAKQRELESLNDFDIDAERARLDELTASIENRRQTAADLKDKLKSAESESESLTAQKSELESKIALAENQIDSLRSNIENLTSAVTESDGEIARLCAERDRLEDEKEAKVEEKTNLELMIEDKREYIANYESETIEPLKADITAIDDKIQELVNQKSQLDADRAALEKQRAVMIGEMTRLRSNVDEIRRRTGEKEREKEETLRQAVQEAERRSALESELKQLTEQLGQLQSDSHGLETADIPERKSQLEEERRRFEELTAEAQRIDDQLIQLASDIDEIRGRVSVTGENLEMNRKTYEALTKEYKIKNEAIEKLEQQLDELRNKTDEEKHAAYTVQLEESRTRLETILRECGEMEAELRQLDGEIETKRAEKSRLDGMEKEKSELISQFNDSLRRLEPVAKPEYVQRLDELRDKVKLLRTVRDRLSDTLDKLRTELGGPAVNTNLADSLGAALPLLEKRIDELREGLVKCADSVKLEVKQ